MHHFVQYHDPDVMGSGVESLTGSPCFFIYTSRQFSLNPIGSTIWLAGRRNDPADNSTYLRLWFYVDEVIKSDIGHFQFRLNGEHGSLIEPMQRLNDEPVLYRSLLRVTGNFDFGLTEIKSTQQIEALHRIAKPHSPHP